MAEPCDRPGWLLDETANAGRENLDVDHVARYDSKMDASAAEEVGLCRGLVPDGKAVVELGAGTGQFACAAAAVFERVVAVDVSPVMLARLREKIAAAGVDNVDVVQAGFLTYEHQGPPADLVYSRFAHHHLPDFWKGVSLARVYGMLRPGGVFRLWDVVYDFEPDEASERIEAWCATGAATATDVAWGRDELEEHVRDEDSTFTWLLEPMIERVGFEIEQSEHTDDGIFAKYVLRRP